MLQLLEKTNVALVLGIVDPLLDANAVFEVNDFRCRAVDVDIECPFDQLVEAAGSLGSKPDVELAVWRGERQARVCLERGGAPRLYRIESWLEPRWHPPCL